MKRSLCVLTIAGSDSGAGAGVQADARTIHALGGYALTAITAVTAQNTRGVKAWRAVGRGLLRAQIEAVLGDFPVAAIKTGLLPGAAAVRVVVEMLKDYSGRRRMPLVIDPVVGSTSGTRFLSVVGLRALKAELLPWATLVTPNWPEAETLSGLRVRSFEDAERAGREILRSGCGAVLVKGGHAPGGRCRDVLVMRDASDDVVVRWFEGARVKTWNTHGTGCVLSAAIAVELAKGRSLTVGIKNARRFLRRALENGKETDWGGGAGPAFAG
ncbi:bifunctional hydroxymethylpyrimidine kinase/phosphomethylpyrimidine kinase [Nibricoccus aquaticus]|uniref:hydroxymethylpyrimidine kinase n=1 Tax=Nibricoccus aquaticus TaxID=2576891 RepID=A0A290Q8N8_9BACT|nr:bifunctional hydroxymethylpyrimidine kinase/phosphomethylpyrimidine kinase [Nibricoccus aquaticus]ATC65075.1 bifunctional hydroxymethylpyrimidine kinase/phosphomethylpyrimidine kinase [Nibricoccus aquaticus]